MKAIIFTSSGNISYIAWQSSSINSMPEDISLTLDFWSIKAGLFIRSVVTEGILTTTTTKKAPYLIVPSMVTHTETHTHTANIH